VSDSQPRLYSVPGAGSGRARPGEASPGDAFEARARRLRHRYQQGLLAWLRGGEANAGLETMREALEGLQALCGAAPAAELWRLSARLVERLTRDTAEPGVSAAYLLATLDRRMKPLAERGVVALAESPPPDLAATLRGWPERGGAGTGPARAAPPADDVQLERVAALAEEAAALNARARRSLEHMGRHLDALGYRLERARAPLGALEGECEPPLRALSGAALRHMGRALAGRLRRAYLLTRGLAGMVAEAARLQRALAARGHAAGELLERQEEAGRALREALAELQGRRVGRLERAWLVDTGADTLALPAHAVVAVTTSAGKRAPEGWAYPLLHLEVFPGHGPVPEPRYRVLLELEGRRLALAAERVQGPLSLAVQRLEPPLEERPWVRGGALSAGGAALVVDAAALLAAHGAPPLAPRSPHST